MALILIRHAEPDLRLKVSHYPKYEGWRHDLLHLSDKGRLSVMRKLGAIRRHSPSRIISSPYPRCLETAAIISRSLDLPLHVQADLHEWLPVKDGAARIDASIVRSAAREFLSHRDSEVNSRLWESREEVFQRAARVLLACPEAETVLVVTHDVVIRALTGASRVPYLYMHKIVSMSRLGRRKLCAATKSEAQGS